MAELNFLEDLLKIKYTIKTNKVVKIISHQIVEKTKTQETFSTIFKFNNNHNKII